MQPNDITLAVNDDNDDGTTALVNETFSRFAEFQNRSEYIHSDHTLAVRNKFGLYRTLPKASGNFPGTSKTMVKFTQDFTVPGVDTTTSLIVPGLVTFETSFPVGLTPAQTKALRMRCAAMIIRDDIMIALTDQLMV